MLTVFTDKLKLLVETLLLERPARRIRDLAAVAVVVTHLEDASRRDPNKRGKHNELVR